MIDYKVLEKLGTTRERLKEFFTVKMPSEKVLQKLEPEEREKLTKKVQKDLDRREKLRNRICSWINEGMVFGLDNYNKFAALDMAWDSRPIQKHIIPLLAYAEGRINFERCRKELSSLPTGQKYIRKDEKGKPTSIDLPTFFDMNINIVRSVITRRKATQCNRYNNLWPFFKYEARSTGLVGRLRADVVSQRMDIMADQYDYRQHLDQVVRNMLLYPFCITFPRCAWERDLQMQAARVSEEFSTKEVEPETIVEREGISWEVPHPCHIIWDNRYPLSSINTDTGCEFVGYWNVMRYGDIKDNPAYFNRREISYKQNASLFWQHATYFNANWDKLKLPPLIEDVAGANDRRNNIGVYTATDEDMGVTLTELYIKVKPKDLGIGRYPFPVWLHLKVAGDDTVVFADIMPSRPAAYFGWNNNDGRLLNPSMGHDLMQYQDMLTNLFSKLLKTIQQDLFLGIVLNTDIFGDGAESKKAYDNLKASLNSQNWYSEPLLIEASFQTLMQNGIKPSDILAGVRMPPNDKFNEIMQGIMQVIAMADRMQTMTSQEQGQPSPSGISATETSFLAGAKENLDEDISNAADRGRAAMKVISYESWMACGHDDVQLPVINRYPEDIIKRAGLTPVQDDTDEVGGLTLFNSVKGKKFSLQHDFIFTSRDGTDRVNNVTAANSIVAALQAIHQAPDNVSAAVMRKLGASKYFNLLNTVFRLSTGEDLGLEVAPGESDEFMLGPDERQQVEQITQVIQRMTKTMEGNANDIAQIKQLIMGPVPQQAA